MPTKKSGKNGKSGKNFGADKQERKFVEKDDDTEYGVVTKVLGGSKFLVKLNLQEKEIICRLNGKFKKGAQKKFNWVSAGSTVLLGIRDFQDDMMDIIHVYDPAETRQLLKRGDLVIESETMCNTKDENDVCDFVTSAEADFDFSAI
jgi:initiation factor 1A